MRRLVSIFFLITIAFYSHSQTWKRNRIEFFIGLPINHYFGDIGGSSDKTSALGFKDISYRAVRGGLSFGTTYRLNQILYVQGAASIGFLGNTDKGSRNETRDYGFSTFGTEVSATAMLFIIPESEQNYFYSVMQLRGGLRHMNKPFSLYVFAGGGGLFYDVSPRQNLTLSDRFDNSQKITAIIPFGVGIKYKLWARTVLGAEFGGRYVLSDYIDGFAPTKSKYNDMYYILTFKVYHRFNYEKILKKIKWKF